MDNYWLGVSVGLVIIAVAIVVIHGISQIKKARWGNRGYRSDKELDHNRDSFFNMFCVKHRKEVDEYKYC